MLGGEPRMESEGCCFRATPKFLMRKIKTLFVIDSVFHIAGGTEGQLSRLINCLDRNEFEPHLVVLRDSSWIETNYFNCSKSVLGLTSLRNPGTWRKIWQLATFMRGERFDIVQTHFPDSNLVGVMAARLGRARKVVSTQRNMGYDLNPNRTFALRMVSRWVDRYLANCQAVKEGLALKLGVPRDKVDIIYNGIEYQRFEKASGDSISELRGKLGIEDEELVVGLVSNFRPIKDVDGFILAASGVARSFPQARFLIIGGGKPEDARRLERLSSDLGIGQKILWTGTVEDVAPYLDLLDLGVLSSRSEGLSNTILEYMASGLPVVATAVGGNPELIADGEGGFLVPPGDSTALAGKILLLLNDAELRNTMGKINRRVVKEKFSLTQMVANYQEYFRQLLNQ
jgi:glycosyltransferase involved in cell wall biosynthesis